MFPDLKSAGKTAEIVCFHAGDKKQEKQYTKISRKTMHRNVFADLRKISRR